MSVTIVIPARLESRRLPRKVLLPIHDRPMLWHVWSRAQKATLVDSVFVATDSEEVSSLVTQWGGRVLMTSSTCRSGTERVASTIDRITSDLIINVQADEPLVRPSLLDEMVTIWRRSRADIVTPVYQIRDSDELQDPNVVKVAVGRDDRALYFSRHPIPYVRDMPFHRWLSIRKFWGHVGVYGFPREVLEMHHQLPPSTLEASEQLEQLRFLEAGCVIRSFVTTYHPISVDVPSDLARIERTALLDGEI